MADESTVRGHDRLPGYRNRRRPGCHTSIRNLRRSNGHYASHRRTTGVTEYHSKPEAIFFAYRRVRSTNCDRKLLRRKYPGSDSKRDVEFVGPCNIANVNAQGVVVGMGAGVAQLSAAYQGVTGSASVTVGAPALLSIAISSEADLVAFGLTSNNSLPPETIPMEALKI